jgi:hypothetical protein
MNIPNGTEHMCEQGNMKRMLSNVLRGGAAHQAPALNILKPIQIGGKMVVQF